MSSGSPLAVWRRQSRLVRVALWTSWAVFAADLAGLFAPASRRAAIDRGWKRRWARAVVGILGLQPAIVRGTAAPRRDVGRLVVANHRTPLDVVALLHLFEDAHFLANHRTARAPIVGRAARRIGTIFVDREDRNSGASAIRAMRRALGDGKTLVVFPEGTTFAGDEVRPFKSGAFRAVEGLDADVVPVGIAYTPGHEFASGRLGDHLRDALARRRTPVWIAIGEATPVGNRDRTALADTVRAQVQQLVHASRRAADEALGALQAPSRLPPGGG